MLTHSISYLIACVIWMNRLYTPLSKIHNNNLRFVLCRGCWKIPLVSLEGYYQISSLPPYSYLTKTVSSSSTSVYHSCQLHCNVPEEFTKTILCMHVCVNVFHLLVITWVNYQLCCLDPVYNHNHMICPVVLMICHSNCASVLGSVAI